MLKWIIRGILVATIGCVGYGAWDFYRAGFYYLPEMPERAFPLSYQTGLKAILVDIPDERETRSYFGFPLEVPFYLKDVWSFCRPPTKEELPNAAKFLADRNMPGERFEAVCKIQADKDLVIRGLITSVPRL
jgi:hypothetical protein